MNLAGRYIKTTKNNINCIPSDIGDIFKIREDDYKIDIISGKSKNLGGFVYSKRYIGDGYELLPENFNPNKKHYEIYY